MRWGIPVLALVTGCSGTHVRPPAARDAGSVADTSTRAGAVADTSPHGAGSVADTTLRAPVVTPVPLPGGDGGIGFDDLQFSPALDRVIVPAGRTGALDLLQPATGTVTQIGGFTADARYAGGHGEGTTSAVDAGRWLLAIDRTALELVVIDPAARAIVQRGRLAASPDYVRWIPSTSEAWVTEPDADQIEVFTLAANGKPAAAAIIRVPGGPESLVVSAAGTAYSHLWKGSTVAIDPARRAIVATWPNGCTGSRGIALDDARGWLFAGCSEGKATVLDLAHGGALLSSLTVGAGVDIIAYAPSLRRLYVPSAKTGTLSILAVADDGALSLVATAAVAKGAHCATTDDAGQVWVCDPDHGRILAVH